MARVALESICRVCTLDASSDYFQPIESPFTAVKMPRPSTLVLGQSWGIFNITGGLLCVQSHLEFKLVVLSHSAFMRIVCIRLYDDAYDAFDFDAIHNG